MSVLRQKDIWYVRTPQRSQEGGITLRIAVPHLLSLTADIPIHLCTTPLLLQVCGLEALNISADWTYPAPISRTPIYVYSLVLLLDFVLYSALAAVVIESTHRTRTPMVRKGSPVQTVRAPTVSNSNGASPSIQPSGIYDDVIAWGIWTLGTLGGIFGTAVGIISQGAGYFWGREVHSYSTLSQEQRTYLDNFDVNYYSKRSTPKNWQNLPRKSASAFEVRPAHRSRSAPFGSRSLGDIKLGRTLNQDSISMSEDSKKYPEEEEEMKSRRENGNSESEGIGPKAPVSVPLGPPQTCMRIVDLCKEYRTGRTGVVILHEINAELRQGTVTCLLGESLCTHVPRRYAAY